MAFYLLKWVFNSIKKGAVVSKTSIVAQLEQNPELLAALSYSSVNQLSSDLQSYSDQDELTW